MTIFGDAESKGEESHPFTQTLSTAQRHQRSRTRLSPDGPNALIPCLGFVCRTLGQAAQTHRVLWEPGGVSADTTLHPLSQCLGHGDSIRCLVFIC